MGASAIVFDGLVDPPSLEAQACNEALALAKDPNPQRVQVASDCLEVVKNINKGGAPVYGPFLHEIKDRMEELEFVNFSFEFCESNYEAHALVKAATSLAVGRHLWLGILPNIICIPHIVISE